MKKMLPDAGGTRIEKTTWLAGESKIVTQSWAPKNIFDVNQLAVIVFLQDNITKEIYQATFAQPEETPPIITGIDPLPESYEENGLLIYPNPASDKIQVVMEKNNISHWKIHDKFGREVLRGHTGTTKNFTIDVQTLASGLYILQLENKDKQLHSARFSVIR
jgi:hypothetical protein